MARSYRADRVRDWLEPQLRRWLFMGVAAVGCVVLVAESRSLVRELRSKGPADAVDDGGRGPADAPATETDEVSAGEPASTRAD